LSDSAGVVFRVTQATAVGPFPGRSDVPALRAAGITHVLNVAASHHDLDAARDGLVELVARPISDAARLRGPWLETTLTAMHTMASAADARLLVHCHAGHQRAPTILWLYLCACGVPPGEAADWIRTARPGAEPGHRALVDASVLDDAIAFGAAQFLPLTRPIVAVRV